MKKGLSVFISASVLLIAFLFYETVFTSASEIIRIYVNGNEVKPRVQPMLVEDTVMVPIRAISEGLGAEVVWDEETSSVLIKTKDKILKTVASIPDEGIELSAAEVDWTYRNFTLEANGANRFFDWKCVTNPSYAPKLYLDDINQDEENELIVILTTGYGTGVHKSEAHVLNSKTLDEYYIDNPEITLLKHVKSNISENKIEIAIDGQKNTINKDKFNIEADHLFSDVSFGSICRFEVVNNELRVTMPAQISPACFIGELRISYIFRDNMYQTGSIEFIDDSRYMH